MSEESAFDWDSVDIEEEAVTETDHLSSESLSFENFIGKAICTVASSTPKEKGGNGEIYMVSTYKYRIDKVLTIEQPVIGQDGNPLMKDPEPWEEASLANGATKVVLKRKQPVKPENQEKVDALVVGTFIFDDIGLPRPGEKDFFRRRRLFFLKKVGVLAPNDNRVTKDMLARAPIGRQIIVETGRQPSKDKTKCYVNVLAEGYESIDTLEGPSADELDI